MTRPGRYAEEPVADSAPPTIRPAIANGSSTALIVPAPARPMPKTSS